MLRNCFSLKKEWEIFIKACFSFLFMDLREKVTQDDIRLMFKEAKSALSQAYAPLTHFHVGAAVLANTGKIYRGCNIQDPIIDLGICAERAALAHAISFGAHYFPAVLIVGEKEKPLYPCGVCCQALLSFRDPASDDMLVIVTKNKEEETQFLSLRQLLPHGFTL
ncbi:MAG: cytidine deaminase [archaeon GW2011_AR17]|nr:MAG: cytidine deaminase [archaeon GW2011_AR17]